MDRGREEVWVERKVKKWWGWGLWECVRVSGFRDLAWDRLTVQEKQTENCRNRDEGGEFSSLLPSSFSLILIHSSFRESGAVKTQHSNVEQGQNKQWSEGNSDGNYRCVCLSVCVYTLVLCRQCFGRMCGLDDRCLHIDLELPPLMETTVVMVKMAGVHPCICGLWQDAFIIIHFSKRKVYNKRLSSLDGNQIENHWSRLLQPAVHLIGVNVFKHGTFFCVWYHLCQRCNCRNNVEDFLSLLFSGFTNKQTFTLVMKWKHPLRKTTIYVVQCVMIIIILN